MGLVGGVVPRPAPDKDDCAGDQIGDRVGSVGHQRDAPEVDAHRPFDDDLHRVTDDVHPRGALEPRFLVAPPGAPHTCRWSPPDLKDLVVRLTMSRIDAVSSGIRTDC